MERKRDGEKASQSKARKRFVRRHPDLQVYQRAFAAAMRIFDLSKKFPPEERYSLTDQIRRASRSVCSNTAEAWRKRRYPAAFVSRLGDAEGEAAETQVWLQFAVACGYMPRESAADLYNEYDAIIAMLVDYGCACEGMDAMKSGTWLFAGPLFSPSLYLSISPSDRPESRP